MLSSIRLVNTGRIPLSLHSVGGLSIVLNFIECPINCDWCPWESNITSRSARLIQLDIQNIITWTNNYGADTVFLHGAEPYAYVERSAIEKIKSGAATAIGMKINPLIAKDSNSFYTLLEHVDVALFEVVLNEKADLQISSLHYMLNMPSIRSKHVEVLIVAETYRGVDNLIERVIDTTRNYGLPINIVLADSGYNPLYKIVIRKRKEYPLIQAPIADIFEIASTPCPVCGSMLIVRRDGVVYKVNIDDWGRCSVCGSKLAVTRAKKLVKLPLNIPLV